MSGEQYSKLNGVASEDFLGELSLNGGEVRGWSSRRISGVMFSDM